MPRRLKKKKKTVETLTHDEASRKNIPTAEVQSVMRKDEQSPIRIAYERRNRDLDPQLVWRGKDEQDWSDLVVQAPPLYIQEKVHPKVLIDDLRRQTEAQEKVGIPQQIDLFADFNGLPDEARSTEFYQHDANWSNRMILGDSLQVMASLAEREGLRGKIQCIYIDPPYGIKFNSNFQWSTTSRDVKDGKADHITREPEQVKAFRDTTGGKGEDLVLSQTMVKRVLTQKTSFLTTDAQDQPGTDPVMSMVSQGIRAAIAAPLFDNEEVIGVLYADNTRPNWHLSRDELSAFTMLANVIAVALSHARYHAMEEEKQRQDAEMTAATEILRNILPAELPACDGYDLSAHLEPCYDVGGDLYDAYSLPDGRHAFFIGDVTGKGLGAALLVSHLISLTRFMLDEGFEPAELMRRLNQQIYRCTDHVRFATFFIGFLDPQSGRIQCANAGHNAPLVIRANGETGSCPATGLPVGIMEDSVYETGELSLNDEDLLALFSDGITETQRDEEEEYGDDRFRELLVRERGKDLPAIFGTLQGELRSFRGEEPVGDDVTLMLLRKNHYSGGPHAR